MIERSGETDGFPRAHTIDSGKKRSQVLRAILSFAVLLACLLPNTAVAQGPPAGGRGSAPPPAVVVEAISERDVNPPNEYVGRVEAIQSVDLVARVEGFLEQVNFEEGGYVKEGDLLYVIEQDLYQAQVNEDQAAVAKARAALTSAQEHLDRVRSATAGAVSADQIDIAVSDRDQAKAALEEATATLARSRLDLGYTEIWAPISGRIGLTRITRGNLVGPDTGILSRIVQVDPIRVVYSVSELDLPEILSASRPYSPVSYKQSRIVQLKMPDEEIYDATGRVEFMDNVVDAKTGTIAFRAVFSNPDGYLVPGQYVTVLVSARESKRMPVVPQAAVLEDRQGKYVFVVDSDDRVRERRITTGPNLGTVWAVTSGLTAGETVIVQGIQKVSPGQTVKPTPSAPSGEGPGT